MKIQLKKEKPLGNEYDEGVISRKEAIKKTGYFAISVATTMILLGTPNKAHADGSSPAPPP